LSVSGGKLQTTLSGLSVGEKVVIYSSTDLQNWTPIQTNIVNSSTLTFTNAINPAVKNQFFRAMVQ
jgi:beta-xylosidase